MADITLTEAQVRAANNAPSIPKVEDGSAPAPAQSEQIPVIMPAKRLEIQGENEPTPTLNNPNDSLNPNQVAKLKGLLDKLEQAPDQTPPENLPPTTEGLPRIDELGVPAPSTQAPPPATPEITNFDLPEDENATKFKQAFEKYLGFPLENLKTYSEQYAQAIGELQRIRQDQYYSSAVNQLANAWGIDTATAEGRLDEVQKRFSQYSKEMQTRLDNVEGAKLIWARLESEAQQRQNAVPQFQRSRGSTPISTNDNWMFSEAQLDAMSPEEYERNADKIYQAYQLKLVKPA